MDKTTIVSIVVGGTSEVPYKLYQSLETLQLSGNLYRNLQKAVLIDTCSVMRRVVTNPIIHQVLVTYTVLTT